MVDRLAAAVRTDEDNHCGEEPSSKAVLQATLLQAINRLDNSPAWHMWVLFSALSLSPLPPSPLLLVNLFPSRRCNYECGFCFHTAKNGRELTLAEATKGLRLLAAAGTEKVNIAGGEPFMRPDFLGKLVGACADLGLKVTIISNGSLIRRKWMEEHGRC